MCRDNLPTVQLQTWELNANLYDGASTAGPVPTIFSDDSRPPSTLWSETQLRHTRT